MLRSFSPERDSNKQLNNCEVSSESNKSSSNKASNDQTHSQ